VRGAAEEPPKEDCCLFPEEGAPYWLEGALGAPYCELGVRDAAEDDCLLLPERLISTEGAPPNWPEEALGAPYWFEGADEGAPYWLEGVEPPRDEAPN